MAKGKGGGRKTCMDRKLVGRIDRWKDCIYIYIYVCVCVCVYVYIYIYKYLYKEINIDI